MAILTTVRALPLVLVLSWLSGCAALSEDMRRTELAFVEARYENVQVWLRELEPNVPDMTRLLRTRYYYMAGITAARLGERARARHYLVLCREEAGTEYFALSEERVRNLKLTLADLLAE